MHEVAAEVVVHIDHAAQTIVRVHLEDRAVRIVTVVVVLTVDAVEDEVSTTNAVECSNGALVMVVAVGLTRTTRSSGAETDHVVGAAAATILHADGALQHHGKVVWIVARL